MSKVIERVKLFYREGRSDKVYEIELIDEGNGLFHVIGYNGRRGAQLVAQPKTSRAVPLATARRIFIQLEQAKLNHKNTPYRIERRETFVPANNTGINNIDNVNAAAAGNIGTLKPVDAPPVQTKEQTQEQATDSYKAAHLDAIEL